MLGDASGAFACRRGHPIRHPHALAKLPLAHLPLAHLPLTPLSLPHPLATAASAWERFIAQVEEGLRGWGLSGDDGRKGPLAAAFVIGAPADDGDDVAGEGSVGDGDGGDQPEFETEVRRASDLLRTC